MTGEVVVTAPARLHFGFVNLSSGKAPGQGPSFGGVGLSVAGIANEFVFSHAGRLSIKADEADIDRKALAEKVQSYCRHIGVDAHMHIHIKRAIPRHQGLGSGTQLALTIGHGIGRLFSVASDSRDIASFFGRGARSGIGIAAFDHGGFIIDGGKHNNNELPEVIARCPWPEAWRIVLVFDPNMRGLHGERERKEFARLPAPPAGLTERLSKLVSEQMLPAVKTADFRTTSKTITQLQEAMGKAFKAAQGGEFASPLVRDALHTAQAAGITGIGQSSWGPTGFALCQDADEAASIERTIRAKAPEASLCTVPADNGAPRIHPNE